jgi:hypothetical protein
MMNALRYSLLGLLATAGLSSATFSITVTPTGGPSFTAYNSGSTSGSLIDLLDGSPFNGADLILNYNITNSPGSGFFQINSLFFVYQNNPNPISFQVTITESTATYPVGAGNSVVGFTDFGASGNALGSFDSTTTFAGTGANTISFPTGPFTPIASNYSGSTSFISGGTTGAISIQFNVTVPNNSNVSLGANGAGTGLVGVQNAVVPVPPTAIAGLLAVPVLGAIRRRRK